MNMSKKGNRGTQDFQTFVSQIAGSYLFKAEEMEPLCLTEGSSLHAQVLVFITESMLSALSTCLHKRGQSKDIFLNQHSELPDLFSVWSFLNSLIIVYIYIYERYF